MRGRHAWAQNFIHGTFHLGPMALTVGILWTLLCPWHYCQLGHSMLVDYLLLMKDGCAWARNLDPETFGLGAMTLTAGFWSTLCVHGIEANVARLCL